MHVVLCYPFLDLRYLIEPVPRPGWQDGNWRTVGSLGPVLRRIWDGEEAEIRADAALSFGREYQRRLAAGAASTEPGPRTPGKRQYRERTRPQPRLDNGFTVIQRRLLADSLGQVRLELILRDDSDGGEPLADRLDTLLATPAYVVREGQVDLLNAGYNVARLYFEQSAKTVDPPAEALTTQLIREGAGSPFLIVLHSEAAAPADDGRPADGGSPLEIKPKLFDAVSCQLIELAGRTTGVWQIWGSGVVNNWLDPARYLCRIICQLSDVTLLPKLQQDSTAYAPHLFDRGRVDQFMRVRMSQLRRRTQGPWTVEPVQAFAGQHVDVPVDGSVHSRGQLEPYMDPDNAGSVAKKLGEIGQTMNEAIMLKNTDKQRLATLLANQAINRDNFFPQVIRLAALPQQFKFERQGDWSGDYEADAYTLIDWALSKKTNPAEPSRATLASILIPQLGRLGLEDAAVIVAIIVAYRLIRDEAEMAKLQIAFQVPVAALAAPTPTEALGGVGPDFTWHGPDEVELQSWFSPDAPDFLDVGYLIAAIQNAASVCRVEVKSAKKTGTGVLINDRLVLTNHHVVKDVFADGAVGPDAASITVTFGSFAEETPGIEVPVDAANPILEWSPAEELDFALLQLSPEIANATGARAATIFAAPPAQRASLSILQHPAGGSMKLAPSENAVTFVDAATGIVQYVTRTAHGSSGAPCFDDRWRLVAIHHAERSKTFGSIREGILMGSIQQRIQKHMT